MPYDFSIHSPTIVVVRGSASATHLLSSCCCEAVSSQAVPFVAKVGQPAQTFLLIQFVPVTDRVIIQVQNFRHRLATHSVVEQQQGIRSSAQAHFGLPIPHQRDEVPSGSRIKKAAANHASRRIASSCPGKPFFADLWNRGIHCSHRGLLTQARSAATMARKGGAARSQSQ